jgi:transglutaminase-like putative cysteine protease
MSWLGRLAQAGAAGRLARLRDILSLLQIGLAIAAVALAGSASPGSLLVTLGLAAWAMLRPLPEQASLASTRLWTALVVVALPLSAARALLLGGELLVAGVDFLLLLVVQRLFNRQRSREHMQLLLLGAVLMVIAAVIDAELHFPILLALFLPSASLALLVNHLLGEGERLGVRVQYEVDRYGTRELPRLGRASLQVAAIAAFAGVVTFLIFPRFGPGVFLRGSLYGDETVGFSDEVRLGGFGTIKTDASVVMHIEPLDLPEGVEPTQKRLTWHLRGSAFDHYEDGRWGRSKGAQPGILTPTRGYWMLADASHPSEPGVPRGEVVAAPYRFGTTTGQTIAPHDTPGFADDGRTVRLLVTMEDIGTDLLFAASRPIAYSLSPRGPLEARNQLVVDVDEQVRVLDRKGGPIQYEFVSRVGVPTPRELQAIGDPSVPTHLAAYVQLEDDRRAELRELALEITASATTRYDKVVAVQDYLLDNYAYSLDQPLSDRVRSGELDPIEGFLLDTKAGHCEYFATAMALLLREVEVPTRNVNGFYGAHYNDIGGFWAVRQADAHSWVEVYFEELGWVTFDPTPPEGRTAGDDAPWFPRIAEAIDALRNAYLEYVIDFDLARQLEILEQLGVRREGRRFAIDWQRLGPWLGGGAALLVALALLRRRRSRRVDPPEVVLYRRLLAAMAKRGRGRREHESARAWAQRLLAEGAPEAARMQAFARRYDALRFDPRPPSASELDELRALVDAVLAQPR